MKIPETLVCDVCQAEIVTKTPRVLNPQPTAPRFWRLEEREPSHAGACITKEFEFHSLQCLVAFVEHLEREAEASTAAERRAHADSHPTDPRDPLYDTRCSGNALG